MEPDDIDDLARRARADDRDALEALLNVATKIGGWGEQGRFTSWRHVVAVTSSRSAYRRLRNQAVASDVLPLEKPDPRTTSVIASDEIAQQVGAPLGTIKAQIHHGRKLVDRC